MGKIMSKINKDHIKNIILLYKQGKSCSAIAEIYNVNRETIRKYLHKNNIKIKSISNYRKYSLNINFFDEINTEEKAYILGLLYADGCNSINMSGVNLVLQEKDKTLLEKINQIIGSNKPLSFRKVPNRKDYKCQNQFCLHISSKHICQRMIELGCPPKKSLILKFPTEKQVPLHLTWHFIRRIF